MSGGRRKEEPPQPQLANGALKVSVWSKVLRSDAAWEDKVRWDLAWFGRGARLDRPDPVSAPSECSGHEEGLVELSRGQSVCLDGESELNSIRTPPLTSVGSRIMHAFFLLQDEFLDVIYWFRQIIAVVLGVIWGVLPLRGFLGIAGFCLINAGVLYLYFSNYLQIDEEEYGGTWELTKEGFMTSFALFMVCGTDHFTASTVIS
ncbi:putative protein RAB5IF [Galemys pyrenaicus]|uniref:RAB5 interacting factor n=1 Tax=Galemys pyrenaicus TaxID=202257 RepID=A0A8J6DQ38_GALPY|nr:putative protein RAB5IF [Galemys pyrenaicus]